MRLSNLLCSIMILKLYKQSTLLVRIAENRDLGRTTNFSFKKSHGLYFTYFGLSMAFTLNQVYQHFTSLTHCRSPEEGLCLTHPSLSIVTTLGHAQSRSPATHDFPMVCGAGRQAGAALRSAEQKCHHYEEAR